MPTHRDSASRKRYESHENHSPHPRCASATQAPAAHPRSEEHTPELQSLMRIPYAVFCLKKKNKKRKKMNITNHNSKRVRDISRNKTYVINNETLTEQ